MGLVPFLTNQPFEIIIFASLVAISPSLIGVAQSRYLIMFYTPFIIFAAKVMSDMFQNVEINKIR